MTDTTMDDTTVPPREEPNPAIPDDEPEPDEDHIIRSCN